MSKSAPAILLIKTSSLGDVIHNLPVVADIKAQWPGARIDWVVEEGFAAIPRLHPGVSEVIPVAIRRWRKNLLQTATWRELADFKRRLQSRSYDFVIDTQGLTKSGLITRLAQGQRCGYGAEVAREPLAARFYDAHFVIPKNQPAVQRNRWLAAAALNYPPDGPLNYGLHAEPLQAPWLPPGPYAVLFTATSRDDKLWPEADWLRLAAYLNAQGLRCILPAGSPVERQRAERLAAQMPSAVAAPPMAIPDLAALLAGARLCVGVDTGLTHLATALAIPTVCLFAASNPDLTGVYPGADVPAINLGRAGAPPSADAVQAVAATLVQ